MEVRHVITQTDVDSLQYTDQIQQLEAESTSGISEEEPIVGTQDFNWHARVARSLSFLFMSYSSHK